VFGWKGSPWLNQAGGRSPIFVDLPGSPHVPRGTSLAQSTRSAGPDQPRMDCIARAYTQTGGRGGRGSRGFLSVEGGEETQWGSWPVWARLCRSAIPISSFSRESPQVGIDCHERGPVGWTGNGRGGLAPALGCIVSRFQGTHPPLKRNETHGMKRNAMKRNETMKRIPGPETGQPGLLPHHCTDCTATLQRCNDEPALAR
jgi:hypothetical protein